MSNSDFDKAYYDALLESIRKDGAILTGDPDYDFGEPTQEDLDALEAFFDWYEGNSKESGAS